VRVTSQMTWAALAFAAAAVASQTPRSFPQRKCEAGTTLTPMGSDKAGNATE